MNNPTTKSSSIGILEYPEHPFSPLTVHLPNYVATTIPTVALLTIFFGGLAVIFGSIEIILKRSNPTLPNKQIRVTSWFVLCGFIHTFFEGSGLFPQYTLDQCTDYTTGYFSYNSLTISSHNDIFGQLWKEYALSDSRYMTQDSFVVCMESITAFVLGPLSFLCAYCIVVDHSLRLPLQLLISSSQLYGLLLYYMTCAFEELVHGIVLSRPEYVYYYGYYLTCNAFWFFIPSWLIYQNVWEISNAVESTKTTVRVETNHADLEDKIDSMPRKIYIQRRRYSM